MLYLLEMKYCLVVRDVVLLDGVSLRDIVLLDAVPFRGVVLPDAVPFRDVVLFDGSLCPVRSSRPSNL